MSSSSGWEALCGQIARIDPDCGEALRLAGQPEPGTLPLLAEALENLECTLETYLVLDSFELSGLARQAGLYRALSRHGGEGLHFVIVTREQPDALLHSHLIYRLAADDFTFSADDTEAYFALAGLPASRSQIETVCKAAGGWVLVLYMQMEAWLQTGSFSSADTAVLIRQVVWEGLPESAREFFLAISILPRFTLQQAMEIMEMDAGSAERLLRTQHAFVRFDRESGAYTLHTIFSAFLHAQFQRLPAARQEKIYRKGGDVSRRAGDRLNTLRFYHAGGAWEQLFALPLTSYEIADITDETTRPIILDVLEHAPKAVKAKHPAALVPFAFALFFLNENARLQAAQAEIRQLIGESCLPEARKNALLGEMDLLMSFLQYNRIDAMSALHRSALARLGGPATLISVKSTWTFGSPSVLYMFWRESGRLNRELEQMDACMPVYYRLTCGHGVGAEHIMRAEAHFLRGEADEAEILCHRAMLAADTARQNSIFLCGLFLLARAAILRGDKMALRDTMQEIAVRSRQNTEDLCRYTHDLSVGYLHALTGRMQAVASWLAEGEITERRMVVMTQPFAYMIYGRCLLHAREYRKLLGVCQHMMALSSVFPNILPQVDCHLLTACALDAIGRRAEACEALSAALDLALPDGVYLPFAEFYDGICALLPAVSRPQNREALARIHTLAAQLSKSVSLLRAEEPALTARERELYDLIRRGTTSNKGLAEALHVSVPTVKTLMGRIYEKTGVSSKAQLVLLDL